MNTTILPRAAALTQADEAATYAKVTWRLLPFLFICYVAAYLDRVNVGFAKLQMLRKRGSNQLWLLQWCNGRFFVRVAPSFPIFFEIASGFSVSAPLSDHPLALFAPPCPLWA